MFGTLGTDRAGHVLSAVVVHPAGADVEVRACGQVAVIVQVTDACPECEADHIDIQALTYNKISPMSSGRISIQYRRVECVPPQKIVVSVDNNHGAGGWLRLFVEVCPASVHFYVKQESMSRLVHRFCMMKYPQV